MLGVNLQKHEAYLKEVIAQCKELCTSFSVLVMRGTLTEDDNVEENRYVCTLRLIVCCCIHVDVDYKFINMYHVYM